MALLYIIGQMSHRLYWGEIDARTVTFHKGLALLGESESLGSPFFHMITASFYLWPDSGESDAKAVIIHCFMLDSFWGESDSGAS